MDGKETKYLIIEVNEGVVRVDEGAQTIVRKITRIGYYWPTMYQDTESIIYRCENCQKHAPIPRKSAKLMINITIPWPFI